VAFSLRTLCDTGQDTQRDENSNGHLEDQFILIKHERYSKFISANLDVDELGNYCLFTAIANPEVALSHLSAEASCFVACSETGLKQPNLQLYRA
jgi:hypothetical protein